MNCHCLPTLMERRPCAQFSLSTVGLLAKRTGEDRGSRGETTQEKPDSHCQGPLKLTSWTGVHLGTQGSIQEQVSSPLCKQTNGG
nr:hypothetical protein [Tanacetum cinerariifolium]